MLTLTEQMCGDGRLAADLFLAVLFPQPAPDEGVQLFVQRGQLVPEARDLCLEVRGVVLGQPHLGAMWEPWRRAVEVSKGQGSMEGRRQVIVESITRSASSH